MEKKLLSLSTEGKLVVRTADGKSQVIRPEPAVSKPVVYLLVDCSTSMGGEKILQAKQGALDFCRTAFGKGYLVGLVKFDESAELLCNPTANLSLISGLMERFVSSGTTNLTSALKIAFQKLKGRSGYRVAVVATDGYPDESSSALETAKKMKKDKIEILAISTEDADRDFLSKLVSRKDLNLKVERNDFRSAMNFLAQKLPRQALEAGK